MGRVDRRFVALLAAFAALRVAPPLAALAAEGEKLPGLPRFDLVAGTGDDAGFYAAAREFMSSWGRVPRPILMGTAAALVAAAVVGTKVWRRRPELRPWVVVGATLTLSLTTTLVVLEMQASGSAVFGWSLLWGALMLPYRAAGLPLDYEIAFAFAFPLCLAANVVTVVATGYAGWWATGRRGVGLTAACALAVWPLVTRPIAGGSAWENGTWQVDTGLALYTEPLSTALVAVGLALVIRRESTPLQLALAGAVLGYATLVKLSDGLVAALAVFVIAVWDGPRRALPLAAAGLAVVPVIAAYWPLGYVQTEAGRNLLPKHPFSTAWVAQSWSESLLFTPRALGVLVPFALVGSCALRDRRALTLLAGTVVATAVLYSLYRPTSLHPRFLFVTLPAFFVLWALGVATVVERLLDLRTARGETA